jgi:RNA polymerase sigma factor (sigma-70 family)
MSFKEVYEKYYPGLVRYGRQLNVDRVDVEDLVQETFMRYHVAISKDIVLENTRAWLYKVMLNLSITSKNTRSLREEKIKSYRGPHEELDVNEEYAKNERRKLVFQVLEQLPVKDKNLLLLYHNGLKYKEIAEVLELNPASIGTLLVRAIDKLRALLKRDYHEMFG